MRDLRIDAASRAARRSSPTRRRSTSAATATASAVEAAGDDPVLRATALALARALGQEVEKVKREQATKKTKNTVEADDQVQARKAKEERPRSPCRRSRPTPPRRPRPRPPLRPPRRDDAAGRDRGSARGDARRGRRRDPERGPSDALLDYLFGKDGG